MLQRDAVRCRKCAPPPSQLLSRALHDCKFGTSMAYIHIVRVCIFVFVCACVYMCVRACVHVFVCVYVSV